MPAFHSSSVAEFQQLSESELTGLLSIAYAQVGFTALKSAQTLAWIADMARLRDVLNQLLGCAPGAAHWTIVLEFEILAKRSA